MVTWNPNDKGSMSLSADLLTIISTNGLQDGAIRATKGVKDSGKYYWELKMEYGASYVVVGIANSLATIKGNYDNSVNSKHTYGAGSFINNDIIGVALDLDNNLLSIYRNNNLFSKLPIDKTVMGTVYPYISYGSSGVKYSLTANFGRIPFKYSMPIGFMPYDSIFYLIKQNNHYFSIKDEFFNLNTKKYNPIGDLIDINLEKNNKYMENWITEYIKQITISDTTFKPIEKFDKINILIKK